MQRKNEGSFWGSSLGIFEGVIFLIICHLTLHADFGLNLWMGCDSSAEHQAATSLTVPDRLFQALCFWKTALVSFVLGFSGPSTVSSRQLVLHKHRLQEKVDGSSISHWLQLNSHLRETVSPHSPLQHPFQTVVWSPLQRDLHMSYSLCETARFTVSLEMSNIPFFSYR